MSAYPNFGKVKTIVLPIDILQVNDPNPVSFEQYKEKTGIDLSFFNAEKTGYKNDFHECAIYLQYKAQNYANIGDGVTFLTPVVSMYRTDEGSLALETSYLFRADDETYSRLSLEIGTQSDPTVKLFLTDIA